MKFIVTRDSVGVNNQSIVVWPEEVEDYLKLDENGMWDGGKDTAPYVQEMSVDEFQELYGVNPPGVGAMRTLVATYEWE